MGFDGKSFIKGEINSAILGLCIFLAPIGFFICLFRLKKEDKQDSLTAKIGLGISLFIMLAFYMLFLR